MLDQQLRDTKRNGAAIPATVGMQAREPLRGAPVALPKPVDWVAMIDRQLASCRRFGTSMAVLSIGGIDLDDIRQRYGSELCERLLQLIWARLRSRLRSTDHVALIGEHEFGAMVLNVSGATAMGVHARVADALCAPYRLGALVTTLSVGTGVALYPQAGSTGEALAHLARQGLLRDGEPLSAA